MVTKEQFKKAMAIVEEYYFQVLKEKEGLSIISPYEVGCRVKLSEFGLSMQGKGKSKLVGTVIDFSPWMGLNYDGTATVKWDGVSKPEQMHITQIEIIK